MDVEAPLPRELSEALASLSEIDDGSEEEKRPVCSSLPHSFLRSACVSSSLPS